jgi:UrcA family protein
MDKSIKYKMALCMMVTTAAAMLPHAVPAADNTTYIRAVSVTDLNLASSSDRALLGRRIRLAARAVCLQASDNDQSFSPNNVSCMAEAVEDARRAAKPLLAAARSPGTVANASNHAAPNG